MIVGRLSGASGKMSIERITERLNEFSIFGGIDAEALIKLDDLFDIRTYGPGAHLIDEGAKGHRLYIITSGEVTVSMHGDSGTDGEVPLAELRAGESFGEMELIDTQMRSATVIAKTGTETLELTNMGLFRIYERDPDSFRMLMMNLARDLSRRLRAADRRLAELVKTGVLPPPRVNDGKL